MKINLLIGLRSKLAYCLRRRLGFPFQELALARLKKSGFVPKVILDVGASNGVFAEEAWLLWPSASAHCFEPDPEYAKCLSARAATDRRLHVCPVLVGAEDMAAKVYYHYLGGSSLYQENTDDPNAPLKKAGPERSAAMTTLDTYCGANSLRADLLKVDVQGYELQVLQGAEKTLAHLEVILTEVNFVEIYDGAPLAAEVVGWLDDCGFVLHDVCNFMRRPLDEALWQCDMIFVKESSPLRRAKRWK